MRTLVLKVVLLAFAVSLLRPDTALPQSIDAPRISQKDFRQLVARGIGEGRRHAPQDEEDRGRVLRLTG